MSKPVPVYWFLRGSQDEASSRIHGHNVHQYLRRCGWESRILVEPLHWLKDTPLTVEDIRASGLFNYGGVAIFQKLQGPATLALLHELRDSAVPTIYIDSDLPLKLAEAALATRVVCSSQYLAEKYREAGIHHVECIPDAFEASHPPRIKQEDEVEDKLKCVWFGVINESSKKWRAIEMVHSILDDRRLKKWQLVTVTRTDRADVQWTLKDSWLEISRGDVAVLPSLCEPWEKAKSSNRAVQAMALGVPVLASPIPAYEEVIADGFNGFLCRSEEDWVSALVRLEDDDLRCEMANNAYEFAREHFSIECIGTSWTSLLERLCETEPRSQGRSNRRDDRKLQRGERKLRARAQSRMASSSGRIESRGVRYLLQAWREWPFDRFLYALILRKCVTALTLRRMVGNSSSLGS